jgi:hypothetical protein
VNLKLKNKNILLISPEPWNHIFVSKHHYATHLAARGNKVFFLNPPSNQEQVEKTEIENVFTVQYFGFIKGLRLFPKSFQKYFISQKFKQLQKLCKVKFDLVWSFDNSVFFDFSALPNEVYCISQIVDWNQNFQFSRASETADLCLASSNYILEKQKKYNLKSYKVGHGFNKIQNELSNIEVVGSNKVKCGYAGNLDIQYIDWNLVEKLLDNFPNVDFHFAGQWNSKNKFSNIFKKPNFYFYGRLEADSLPSFYKKMDLLALIYQYRKYPQQLANPHKMMEYLASGKMILATWTEEYFDLSSDNFIKMNKNTADFISTFKDVVHNLEYWNNDAMIKSRIDFANQNSYSKQIDKIEKYIKSHS